jgi:hypothetical protein
VKEQSVESTEAINVLIRAGRAKEAEELIDRTAKSAQARYREIDADGSRTADYKREEKARIYEGIRSRLKDELNGLAKSAKEAEQRDIARAFGTVGISGDAATLIISRRDAADRVAAVENSEELRKLLARATRTGDEVLARAVAEKALENEDSKTLYAFLEDRPHLDAEVQRLWDAAHRRRGGGMGPTMALMALRPN